MAKFRISINLADAVRQMDRIVKTKSPHDKFYIVVDAFDFGRDVNGNTINKYRAALHCANLREVENGYSDCNSLTVLTSPYRREQSHNEGQSAALYWLEKIGYDLAYESMTEAPHTKKRAYRHVYRVTNNYLKAV